MTHVFGVIGVAGLLVTALTTLSAALMAVGTARATVKLERQDVRLRREHSGRRSL